MSLHSDQVGHAFIRDEELSATRFHDLKLGSAFQPIISLSHRRVVGYEALLRAVDAAGAPVSPQYVFALPDSTRESVDLDRRCRALHLRHFRDAGAPDAWLFLNVSAQVVLEGRHYGAYFNQLLQAQQFPAHRVVVEILEGAVHDEAQLAAAAEYYRSIGCLVAIDDFGAGHSNFGRIWHIKPDIVKLDRSLIHAAAADARARRMIVNMVSTLHEAGSLVLIEGVETMDQALVAMETDADFVQGYFFGRPSSDPAAAGVCGVLEPLCMDFHRQARVRAQEQATTVARLREPVLQAVASLQTGLALDRACTPLARHAGFRRAYLLDSDGFQIGGNVEDPGPHDPRYAPLTDARGASWFRRPYFRKAIDRPGELQRTRPYLSITDARMCATLSISFDTSGERRVLCCDLEMPPT